MKFYDPFLDFSRKLELLLSKIRIEASNAEIDASDLTHKELNDLIRHAVFECNCSKIRVLNVAGQRYIGTGIYSKDSKRIDFEIFGSPGNDLGAFLGGHRIVVYGNAQDGVGNTMDCGEILVHGRAGDVVAMSMRGGRIMIRDDIGYRAAIHMKEYRDKIPVLVVGGTAQDFLCEYMAGGRVILLGLNRDRHRCRYIGTGMHGGIIYIRGKIERWQIGKEVGIAELSEEDYRFLETQVENFCTEFGFKTDEILGKRFTKLIPVTKRPYGKVYVY